MKIGSYQIKKRVIISVILTIISITLLCIYYHHCPVLIIISVGILSYLLAYKITDYIADFKSIDNKSRIDIIFLVIFFILLFVPMLHIDNSVKSILENRYFAKKPLFIVNKQLNLNYGKDFNEWFNDRFATRKILINANAAIKCVINTQTCKSGDIVFEKKYNLIYRNYNFWGMEPIKENKQEILNIYLQNLSNFQKYCDSKNIKLYLLIVPRQCDYFNYDISDTRKKNANPADEVINYWRKNSDVNIIYPKSELAEANKITPVFYKTDHHWTKKGAYVGYVALIKEIKKDFTDISIIDDNNFEKYYRKKVVQCWNIRFNEGQSYNHMGLPKWYAKYVLDTNYLYYKNPNKKDLKVIKESPMVKNFRDVQFYYPNGISKKLMIIGDSFGLNFLDFIPYNFKDTLYIYNNPRQFYFEKYKQDIEKYRPDALVLLFYTPNIPKFLNLYPSSYRNFEVNK